LSVPELAATAAPLTAEVAVSRLADPATAQLIDCCLLPVCWPVVALPLPDAVACLLV